MTSKYEVTGVADLRRTRHATYSAPTTRPPKPVPLIAELYAEWTRNVNRAKRAYYGEQAAAERYARQVAASGRTLRYRRRKAVK